MIRFQNAAYLEAPIAFPLQTKRLLGGWAGLGSSWRGFGSWGLQASAASALWESSASPAHPGGWTRLSSGDLRLENWGARAHSAGETSESGGTRSASGA